MLYYCIDKGNYKVPVQRKQVNYIVKQVVVELSE